MIQKGTVLNIIDNSGIKLINCIYVGKGYKKRTAGIGEIVVASVRKINPQKKNLKLKKGTIVKALILREKKGNLNNKLKKVFFFENSAIIVSNQLKSIGTRIFGSIQRNFKETKFLKIITMAKGLIKN